MFLNSRVLLVGGLLLFVLSAPLDAQTFDPKTIPGLQLWVHTESGVEVDPSNRVMAWQDQSDFKRLLLQATEAGWPLLVQNGISGRPVIRFDGINDSLNVFPFVQVEFLESAVFVVFRSRTQTPGAGLFSWRFHWDGNCCNHDTGTNSFLFALNSQGGMALGGAGYGINTSRFDHREFYLASFGIDSKQFLSRNGEPLGTRNPPSWRLKFDSLAIGARQGANGVQHTFARVDIAEILIYNQGLTPQQKSQVENYLLEKYDLTPGRLALTEARRSYRDRSLVTVQFSEVPAEATALTPENYLVDGTPALSVQKGPDPLTYLLSASIPLDDLSDHELEVHSIKDSLGKGMYVSNSIIPVDTRAILPRDVTNSISGYVDTFDTNELSPDWATSGPAPWLNASVPGMLRISSSRENAGSLFLPEEGYRTGVQEILARVQWITSSETHPDFGLMVSAQPEAGAGIFFRWETNGLTRLEIAGTSHPLAFQWSSNAWHWMRLRHDPAERKVTAGLWRADYDTPEPASVSFTYDPLIVGSGVGGLIPPRAPSGFLHVDYLLIHSPSFPSVDPTPSAPPPFLNFLRGEDELELFWSHDPRGYAPWAVDTLLESFWFPLNEPLLEEEEMFRVRMPLDLEMRFFQLRP